MEEPKTLIKGKRDIDSTIFLSLCGTEIPLSLVQKSMTEARLKKIKLVTVYSDNTIDVYEYTL